MPCHQETAIAAAGAVVAGWCVAAGALPGGALVAAVAVLLGLALPVWAGFAAWFATLQFTQPGWPGWFEALAGGPGLGPGQAAGLWLLAALARSAGAASARPWARLIRERAWYLAVLAVAIAYFSASGFWAESAVRGPMHARYVLVYGAVALGLAAHVAGGRASGGSGQSARLRELAWVVLLLSLGSALYGFWEGLGRGTFSPNTLREALPDGVRVRGGAKNPIQYGWNMLFAVPFGFYLLGGGAGRGRAAGLRRAGLLAAIAALLVASLLTFNRQTFGLAAAMALVCTLAFRFAQRGLVLGGLGLAALPVLAAMLPSLVRRFSTLKAVGADPSFLERRDSFLACLEMIRAHPWLGIGLGSFPDQWRHYMPRDGSTYFLHLHDPWDLRFPDLQYVGVVAEAGVVGLALLLALVWGGAGRSVRQWRRAQGQAELRNRAALAAALMLFIAATAAVQDNFLYPRTWLALGLVAALGGGRRQQAEPGGGARLRVAAFAHLSEVSGSGVALVGALAGLQARGHRVLLVLPGAGPLLARAQAAGLACRVVPNPERSARDGRGRWRVWAARAVYGVRVGHLLAGRRYQVALVNSSASLVAGAAAWAAGVAVLWHVHEVLAGSGGAARARRWIISRVAGAVVVPSRAGARAMVGDGVAPLVISNLIENASALAEAGTRRRAEPLAEYPAQVRLLASAAAELKGTDVLLRALALGLPSGVGKIWVTLFGLSTKASEWRERLEALIGQLPSSIEVEILPPASDLTAAMASADLLVSCSREESAPLALGEAMLAGTPCLATDVGDCAVLLGRGERGTLLPPQPSAETLAAALWRLLAERAVTVRLSKTARQWAFHQYGGGTPPALLQLEQVLARLAGSPRP